MQRKTIVTTLAMLTYLVFFIIAWMDDLAKFYAADIIFSAIFILFLSATYRFWRLTTPIYTLLILAFASHLMGIFGWYNVSPIPLQWDHVTHAFPMFAFTLFFFQFMRPHLGKFWSSKTWGIFILVFLAGLGVGAVVENIEFAGFMALGFGEGALFMGGLGDGFPENPDPETLKEFGGGYINTELDLIWNAIGALAAMFVMSLIHFKKRVP